MLMQVTPFLMQVTPCILVKVKTMTSLCNYSTLGMKIHY